MKHLHTFESFLNEGLFKPANIKAYYEALCKSEGITPLPVRFDSVSMGGAALTFNPKTMKPLYISFDMTKLKDPEYAVIHELTHQIKLETEQNAYLGKNDQSAKFKKLENRLIEKYMYSKFSGILHLHTFESFLNESSDIEYSIKNIEDNDYIVRAMYKGKSVGELYFIKSRSKVLKAGSLSVDPNHRRRGIASSMYEFAEKKLGMKFVRSEDVLTPDGKLLWNNPNRKFGLSESKLDKAFKKIDSLPKGSIFDDAKRIDDIFNITKHSWSDVVNAFEQNEKSAKIGLINIKDIQITQRNIQSNKVKAMISSTDKLKTINVVEFPDGLAIYDGHHRLMTAWARGDKQIKVNLVTL